MMGKERDLDAAERALGTLPRKGENARGRHLREQWELRLAALLRPIEPVTPPPGMFSRISERLAHDHTRQMLHKSRRSARRWQGFSVLSGLAIAGICAFLLMPILSSPEAPERYVAVVTSDDTGAPGMVVEIDPGRGLATVIPVGIDPPEGKAFQMWHLPAGASAPVSIGLLPRSPVSRRNITAAAGDIFAISVEPSGGSPTGQPTDARYHGQAVQVE